MPAKKERASFIGSLDLRRPLAATRRFLKAMDAQRTRPEVARFSNAQPERGEFSECARRVSFAADFLNFVSRSHVPPA